MKITFLLPCVGDVPIGGFKVVYEYANRLVDDNFDVSISYRVAPKFKSGNLKYKIKCLIRYFSLKIKGFSCRRWFDLDKRVKEHLSLTLEFRDVPSADIYFATALDTAHSLYAYPIDVERKYYLIQDYEKWGGVEEAEVYRSYQYGFNNISISTWLKELVDEKGRCNSALIKNGFDFNYFHLSQPIDKRDRMHVAMLYHWDKRKGCKYGLEALQILKRKYPTLKATLFGAIDRPEDLSEWIEYVKFPDRDTHNRIYNEAAIFIAPSLQEGWGLTVGEAMICGAAIVCTETLGFHEMVRDYENGVFCPVADSKALAAKIEELILDDSLRIKLASQGNVDIKDFSWDTSYQSLKELIIKNSCRCDT